MHDTTAPWARRRLCSHRRFPEILDEGINFEEFESRAIAFGHAAIAEAISLSLERKDASLQAPPWETASQCTTEAEDARLRDRDPPSAAGAPRDRCGNTCVPWPGFLDLPWCARVTPGARSFGRRPAPTSPTRSAANLMARHGLRERHDGDELLRTAGRCAPRRTPRSPAEDLLPRERRDAARRDRVRAGSSRPTDMGEPLQGVAEGEPDRVEIKALIAYGSKERREKTRRTDCVHHGCVGIARRVPGPGHRRHRHQVRPVRRSRCHMYADGEGGKRGTEFFPAKVRSTGHLDPFHVNRAVLSCFDKGERPRRLARARHAERRRQGGGASCSRPCATGIARREKGGRGGRLPAQQYRPRGRRGPSLGINDGVREPASVRLAHGQRPVRLVASRRLGDGQVISRKSSKRAIRP